MEPYGRSSAKGYMQVYIFISEIDPKLRAFTADETGGNLPTDYAPWQAVNGGRPLFLASARDPIAMDVRTNGYFLEGSAANGEASGLKRG